MTPRPPISTLFPYTTLFRSGSWNGHAIVIVAIRDQRPAIVLALLDQVQLVAAARTMFHFPQFAGGRKRQPVRRPNAAGPCFSRRQVGSRKRIGGDYRRSFGGLGVTRRIDQGDGGRAGLSEVRITRRRFAVQREPQDLAFRLIRILSGSHALAIANRKEEIVAIGRECDGRAFLAALAARDLSPQHLEVLECGRGGGGIQLRA